MGFLDVVQYLFSFGVVIASLLGLLWLLKRLQNQGGLTRAKSESRLKIVESTSLGARQKVVLMRVDHQDLVLGVTPTGITMLHVAQPLPGSTEEWLRRRQT